MNILNEYKLRNFRGNGNGKFTFPSGYVENRISRGRSLEKLVLLYFFLYSSLIVLYLPWLCRSYILINGSNRHSSLTTLIKSEGCIISYNYQWGVPCNTVSSFTYITENTILICSFLRYKYSWFTYSAKWVK